MVSVALGIPHTPWVPERAAALKKLLPQIGLDYTLFTDREPNWSWSERMWTWGAESGASHFLTLQDDVILAPRFRQKLEAIIQACPDQIIGLSAVHPIAPEIARQGHRWYRTQSWIVGWAYVVPTPVLQEFLKWRASLGERVRQINEDDLLNRFVKSTKRHTYHPVPTIVDHDVSLVSTYSNDSHVHRKATVTWHGYQDQALHNASWWRDANPPLLNLPAVNHCWYCLENEADVKSLKTGACLCARCTHIIAASLKPKPPSDKPRLLICTPCQGRPAQAHTDSIQKFIEQGDFIVDRPPWRSNEDLVRVRSRFVRDFLKTDCDALLFVDSDIEITPEVVQGMWAAGHGVVAAPYPRRDGIDWARALAHGEAQAYRYPIRGLKSGTELDAADCVEVEGTGLGCTLIRRKVLEHLTTHYASLTFQDKYFGTPEPTVALFQLMIRDGELLSEDHSFFARCRDAGWPVHLYLGPGAPLTHHGEHAYRGQRETFGLKAVT
jgi:hypothetical protein